MFADQMCWTWQVNLASKSPFTAVYSRVEVVVDSLVSLSTSKFVLILMADTKTEKENDDQGKLNIVPKNTNLFDHLELTVTLFQTHISFSNWNTYGEHLKHLYAINIVLFHSFH